MSKLLVKVFDETCHVCQELAGKDQELAESRGFEFHSIELADLAAMPEEDPFRGYVVSYHVSPEDGKVDLPIYVIVNDGAIQASSVVKTLEEITNVVDSWEVWLKSQSSETLTK